MIEALINNEYHNDHEEAVTKRKSELSPEDEVISLKLNVISILIVNSIFKK